VAAVAAAVAAAVGGPEAEGELRGGDVAREGGGLVVGWHGSGAD